MKKKILLALSLIAIMTVLLAISISATNPVEQWNISATENDSVMAYLYADTQNKGMYTLTISGTGNMQGWGWNSAPWHNLYQFTISSVTIEDGVTSVGQYAFTQCDGIKTITIGESVAFLGHGAFQGCGYVTEINFNATRLNGLEDNNAVFGYIGVNTQGVTLNVGKNVEVVPQSLFFTSSPWNCNLKTVVFEEGSICTIIDRNAFCNCHHLENISLPSSITTIEHGAFYQIGAKSIVIPQSVIYVGPVAFYYEDDYSSNLTIYTELASQPSTWNAEWNRANIPTVWNYKTTLRENIFTFKGYSFNEAGQIAFGFDVDAESKIAYEELTGIKLEIGALFTIYDYLGGKQPLDNSGKETALDKGKVVKHNLSEYEYLYYDFILTDISDELKDIKIVISAYICNGKETMYEQENGMSDTVTYVTYNEAKESMSK